MNCPACGARTSDGLLCNACTGSLRRTLAWVPELVCDLDVAMSKQAHIGAGSASGIPARERNPINWDAADKLGALSDVLTRWATDVTGVPIRAGMGGHVAHAAALTLLLHLDIVRRHPQAQAILSDVQNATAAAKRAIDSPHDRGQFLGTCLVLLTDGSRCLRELFAPRDAPTVRCPGCKTDHDVPARRAWLLRQAADRLVSVRDAASYIGTVGDIHVTVSMISGYLHRRRLLYRAGTLVRLGDVLDILVDIHERKANA